MPYSIRGNCVYKGETQLKCYDTHEDALAYFRALKANVEDSIHQFSMLISKSSIYDGEMRWAAVNSDTDWDLYGERMSLELYKSMIAKIKAKSPPPEPFTEMVTSDYWKGGMPYLSIAHYSDGNGNAVPGTVKELFVDGTQLKAKGNLYNSPLGLAVWKSLKEDEVNYKSKLDTDRIRISIAFLDLAHKHGESGKIFKRNSVTDVCPECQKGIGEKIYLDGYLVHLALTRVPVNPRTIMEAEDVMAKKAKPETRREDALSVLGGDETLVETIEKANALEVKSDVLVEMSDTEPVVEEVVPEKSEAVVEETPQEETLSVTKSQLETLVSTLVEQAMSKKEMKDDMKDEEDKESESYHGKEKMAKKSDTESESAPVTKSALEVSVDNLYTIVNGSLVENSTADEKLQKIQPALEAVGAAIMEVVRSASPAVTPAQPNPNAEILEAINNLATRLDGISTEVATMKAQTNVPPQSNRVPVPRSITPTITRSDVQAEQVKPGSVKDIVRRSVGL